MFFRQTEGSHSIKVDEISKVILGFFILGSLYEFMLLS